MGRETNKPVDLIITYVDGSDETWKKQLLDHAKKSEDTTIDRALNPRRYRDLGTLKYVFRGIDKFMPFVDRVNLVVSSESQIPKWLNRENVRVILHRDFIPFELLPTFNSCTIESFLWKIPLHPYVLYANDDTFPLKLMNFETFFSMLEGRWVPNIHFTFYDRYPGNNIFRSQCRSGIDVTSKVMNTQYPDGKIFKPQHTINAWLRDSMIELGQECEDELISRASQFRCTTNVNQYIYAYYHYWTKSYVDKESDLSYMTFENGVPILVSEIVNRNHDILCINDAMHLKGSFYSAKQYIQYAFRQILGVPCKYEL